MKSKLTLLTKLTVGALIAVAVALWTQWLSGDPAYPKLPPGPVLFITVEAIVFFGARWWWTPLIGALISLLATSRWFVRLPAEMQRLGHPASCRQVCSRHLHRHGAADQCPAAERYYRARCHCAELPARGKHL